MRRLNEVQKKYLAEHIAKKPIEYIELYNELYDHYATTFENGNQEFEKTISRLDIIFDDLKIKRINSNLLNNTKKAVRDTYWREFKKIWCWPQIFIAMTILLGGITILRSVPIEALFMFCINPVLILFLILTSYGFILRWTKKYGHKKLRSAHNKACDYYLRLVFNINSMSIFLPLFAFGPYSDTIIFFERYPLLILLLLVF